MIGENLVSVSNSEVGEKTQKVQHLSGLSRESVGGPGRNRTCDILLRRPITAFQPYSFNVIESRQTHAIQSFKKISLGTARYRRAPHKREVSGEFLVNFSEGYHHG